MVGLGDLPGGEYRSTAERVSADGSVIVGDSESTSGREAFRWTSGEGMIGLGDLPGGPFESSALGVSADGSVIVGRSFSAAYPTEAFRWTRAEGMVGLGGSSAYAVSADGSVIVGEAISDSGPEAVIWTPVDGMVSIRSLLMGGGVNTVTDWILITAQGLSASGRTIAGWGISPTGNLEAWVATIGEPPYTLVGDANGDFVVDNADLALVAANLGTTTAATRPHGDFDNNGRVNLQDLRLLKNYFGETLLGEVAAPKLGYPIPEPASWAFNLAAMAFAVAFRRWLATALGIDAWRR
jgi:probable HAF family extracellular repeat protein